MKTFILSLIFLFLMVPPISAFAQSERMQPKKFEIIGSIQLAGTVTKKHILLEEKGAIIFANQWGVSLSHTFYTRYTRQLPAGFCCPFMDSRPQDLLETYSLRALKYFTPFSGKLSLGVEAGLAWLYYQSALFTPLHDLNGNDLPHAYQISYKARNSPGISLRLCTGFRLTRMAGIELAAIANIHNTHFYIGWQMSVTGKLVKPKTQQLKRKKRR